MYENMKSIIKCTSNKKKGPPKKNRDYFIIIFGKIGLSSFCTKSLKLKINKNYEIQTLGGVGTQNDEVAVIECRPDLLE